MKISMHFQMAAMYILKGTIKCNVTNHGIALQGFLLLGEKGSGKRDVREGSLQVIIL